MTTNIIFFTQLYYPDMTTTAIIMTDLVEDLAAYGLGAKVICAQPTYIKNSGPQITQINADLKKMKDQRTTYKIIDPQITQIKIGGSADLGKSPRVECHNGVSIRRVWSFLFDKNKILGRILNGSGFRKLRVWREAVELYVFVKEALDELKGLPFKIRDQVLDSAFSISSNVAEGYCRRSIKEYIQFINIALGSAGENYSQFYALSRSEEISKDIFDEYDKRHYSLENKLINLAKSLSKKAKGGDDWNSEYKI